MLYKLAGAAMAWAAYGLHAFLISLPRSLAQGQWGRGRPCADEPACVCCDKWPWVRFNFRSPKSREEPNMALVKLSPMRGGQQLLCVRIGGGFRR